MQRKMRIGVLVSLLLGVVLSMTARPIFAAGEGEVQKRLDSAVKFQASNVLIGEFFEALGAQAKVKMVVPPVTLEYLPYGRQTRLTAKLQNVTLRQALPVLLYSHGLSWSIIGDVIRIEPSKALLRLARRATHKEMGLIGRVLTKRVTSTELSSRANFVRGIRKITGDKSFSLQLPATLRLDDVDKTIRRVQASGPTTLAGALDQFCKAYTMTWYVEDGRIVVHSIKDQLRRQLQRKISLKYRNAGLMQTLLDLAVRSHVPLKFTPGVMTLVPQAVRNDFTLVLADSTVLQALEVVSGATGLEFAVTDEGLAVKPSKFLESGGKVATKKSESTKSPGFFIESVVRTSGGQDLKIFLLPEQLSDQLRKAIATERKRLMDELEKHFVPGRISQRASSRAEASVPESATP